MYQPQNSLSCNTIRLLWGGGGGGALIAVCLDYRESSMFILPYDNIIRVFEYNRRVYTFILQLR